MVKKVKNIQYYEAVGRRRESVAVVRLYLVDKEKKAVVDDLKIKKGEIFVNGKPIEKVFPSLEEKLIYQKPLKLTQNDDRFAISIKVRGGGKKGQLEALTLGIAKALVLVDNNYRKKLKEEGLLRRDSRLKERRKVGTGGKARRKKQSPKR